MVQGLEFFKSFENLVTNSDVYFEKLGIIGGDNIEIKNVGKKSVAALRDNFELGVGAIMFHEEE